METYLIDDDYLSLFLTEHLLRAEGFSNAICTFQSAKEALAQLVTGQGHSVPQVVFLDLNMPEMNGWDFLDALVPHREALRGHCTIYILTSSLALNDLEKSKEYDFVAGLIHKPLNREEIRAILSKQEQRKDSE